MNSPTLSVAATRRQLAREARDAFPPMGVYTVVDRVGGTRRVVATRNVPAAINRTRFELRLGRFKDKAMQAAWAAGGEERVSFEVLAMVKERDDAAFDYDGELRELEALYRDELGSGGGTP